MAAYELTIKAMSRADLEEAAIELGDLFRLRQEGAGAPLLGEAGGDQAGTPQAPVRASRRRRGSGDGVHPAAHPPAAGEAQTHGGGAGTGLEAQGHLGSPLGGGDDGGAVEPPQEDQDQVEAGAAAASDTAGGDTQTETGQAGQTGQEADTVDAGAAAGDAASASSDLPGDADGAAALGVGEAEATLEAVKAAAAELIGKKGFPACKAVFAAHDISKPSDTPPEKFGVVLAGLQKAMG